MTEHPFLRQALDEAVVLRERLDSLGPSFATLQKDGMIEYLHTLYALVEKEEVIYHRLKLADEDWAAEGLAELEKRRKEINLFTDVPLYEFFTKTKDQVKNYIQALDGPFDYDDPLL